MDFFSDIVSLVIIGFATVLLFILPFFLICLRIFVGQSIVFKILASWCIGLFTSMVVVIVLASLGINSLYSFLTFFFFVVVIIHLFSFRQLTIRQIKTRILQVLSKPKLIEYLTRMLKGLKGNLSIMLLLLALTIGFYLRTSFSLSHIALPQIDPYGHLYVAKVLSNGFLYQNIGYYDDYPRGFHATISIIHFYTQMDCYTIMRFIGGIFGVISIASIYCLISSLRDRLTGALAAFIYSGVQITWEIGILTTRQILPTPEILAYAIMPVMLLFAYETLKASTKTINWSYFILFLASSVSLLLIHPYTFMIAIYLLLLLVIVYFLYHRTMGMRSIFTFITTIVILIIPALLAEYFHLVEWGATFNDILTFKMAFEPSTTTMIILVQSVLFISYATIKKKPELVFIGAASLLLAFIITTGILTPSRYPVSRAIPFFGITSIWLIAVSIVEVLGEFERLLEKFKDKFRARQRFSHHILTPKHLSLAVIVIYLATLIPTTPPSIAPFAYEDNIKVTLEISKEFPSGLVVIYSEKVFLVNPDQAIIEPDGEHFELHELLAILPSDFTPSKKYTFIIIENESFYLRIPLQNRIPFNSTIDIMKKGKKWVEEYEALHDEIHIYYRSADITVYLITD